MTRSRACRRTLDEMKSMFGHYEGEDRLRMSDAELVARAEHLAARIEYFRAHVSDTSPTSSFRLMCCSATP